MKQYSDAELIRELVSRNIRGDAPKKTSWVMGMKVLDIELGPNNTASVYLHKDDVDFLYNKLTYAAKEESVNSDFIRNLKKDLTTFILERDLDDGEVLDTPTEQLILRWIVLFFENWIFDNLQDNKSILISKLEEWIEENKKINTPKSYTNVIVKSNVLEALQTFIDEIENERTG